MSKADSIKALLRNLANRYGKPIEYVLTHYLLSACSIGYQCRPMRRILC